MGHWIGVTCVLTCLEVVASGCSGRDVCEQGYALSRGVCVEEAEQEVPVLVPDKVVPKDGAEGVSRSASIVMTFSAPVDASTANADTVRLVRTADGERVPVVIAVEGSEVALTPENPLDVHAAYTLEVSEVIASVSGGRPAAGFSASWRTRASTPIGAAPSATSQSGRRLSTWGPRPRTSRNVINR